MNRRVQTQMMELFYLQQLHNPIQQSMNSFESRSLVIIDGAEHSFVSGPDVFARIFDDDIGNLKQL